MAAFTQCQIGKTRYSLIILIHAVWGRVWNNEKRQGNEHDYINVIVVKKIMTADRKYGLFAYDRKYINLMYICSIEHQIAKIRNTLIRSIRWIILHVDEWFSDARPFCLVRADLIRLANAKNTHRAPIIWSTFCHRPTVCILYIM